MSLETQLRAALIGDTAVNSLIGDRLYHVQLPQIPSYPSGVLQRISTQPLYVHTRGRTPLEGGQATVGWARISLCFWTDGRNAADTGESIAQAVMAAMENFNAWALPQSPSVLFSAPNILITRRTGIEPQTQPPLFKAMLDFKIWYQDQ
jgi:uncharacterized protein DUF3168